MSDGNGNKRIRGDGFGTERKRLFLVALKRGEPVLEACRLVAVSNRTAYNHRKRDPGFARQWDLAKQMHQLPAELAAFERGVVGIEEPVYAYGRLSHSRIRRSDSLLKTLLAGEQPEKYGRRAGVEVGRAWLERRIERLSVETRLLRELVLDLAARLHALEAGTVKVVNLAPHLRKDRPIPRRREARRCSWGRRTGKAGAEHAGISEFPRHS